MKHATGYEIYQVNLNKPDAPCNPDYFGPVAWTLMEPECKATKKHLKKEYPGLYFFITKVS